MLGNRSYLKVASLIVASTVVALAILTAITSYIISHVAIAVAYILIVSMAFLCLLVSLGFGCHGLLKNLMLLGCDQWNVRMISSGFVIHSVFLCMGLLLYFVSLFFVR